MQNSTQTLHGVHIFFTKIGKEINVAVHNSLHENKKTALYYLK